MRMIVAFVHAKANSERLPGKNLLPLGGVPLFVHAVRAALAAEIVGEVWVDSDSEDVLQYGKEAGAQCLVRPASMGTNNTTGDDLAYWQASHAPHADAIVQVVPTSPFIQPGTIERAVDMLELTGVDSVVGVRSEQLYLWRHGVPAYPGNGRLPNSNELHPTTWETTGLYVVKTEYALTSRRRVNPKNCGLVELSQLEAIDINTQDDYEFAEIVRAGLEAQCQK
jgi:CMP-N-acetylneuraminic acid synthetase